MPRKTPRMLDPDGPPTVTDEARPIGRKLLWFVGLAGLSVSVVALSAYVLRGLLFL